VNVGERLVNPFIERKATTPEQVGVNRTRVPAGGFHHRPSGRSAGGRG
jgi:hypothetical protein